MTRGMELWRPAWQKIMEGCCFDNPDAEELVSITHETAKLALAALESQNAQDYYNNYGAAENELIKVLELYRTIRDLNE